MKTKSLILLGCATALAACGNQSPAPVISGYNRMPWEPKLREISTPVAVKRAESIKAVQTPDSQSYDLATIEPAAGPVGSQPATSYAPSYAPAATGSFTQRITAPSQPAVVMVESKPQMDTHMVKEGETVYRIAKDNNTTVAQIMRANNLVSSSLQPGDVLLVPTGRTALEPVQVAVTEPSTQAPTQQQIASANTQQGRYSLTRKRFVGNQPTPAVQASQPAPVQRALPAPSQPVLAAAPAVQSQNLASIQPAAGAVKPTTQEETSYISHRVAPGETLYRIGKTYGVSPLDLMAANHFDRPQDLMSGTNIRVPVKGVQRTAERQINQRLAQAKGMVWPARGKVLNSYGNVGNGVTHTGINIQLPENTPVVAAESGTVIYADEGLKSYGKLVLLRHADGLVTAYAHNNQLNVNKNQTVQKGEVIALSGASGQVTFPQLHFEVRRNAQAINPLSVLPK